MSSPALFPSIPAGGGGARLWYAAAISYRIVAVARELADIVQSAQRCDANHFSKLCLSLARDIDFSVSNSYKPACAPSLPWLTKQVCQYGKNSVLQAAVLVLLLSVKNACKVGWFSSLNSEELLALVDEVGSSFCTTKNLVDQGRILSFVSQITSRFYPWLKLGHIFASLEAKPGFGAYVVDFHIAKDTSCNKNEKINLLVAMKDNIDSSSCIISPNKVNFLLNGRGVPRRTNVMMDTGPQPPTLVEPILKYGTNLLQAVGQFDGHCVIVLGFMSSMPISKLPTPPDYVQPAHCAPDSDADIIEGPSRIKLVCPISLSRIKIPVKGHMCKHHQCFDFTFYVEINLKLPSWRCPHCNQSVCYTDICIDQSMLKILQEVEENVVEVIISEDGSWKAVSSSNNHNELDVRNSASLQGAEQHDTHSGSSRGPCDIFDLTKGDDEIMYAHEVVESKPILQPDPQNTSTSVDWTVPLVPRNTTEASRSSADTEVGLFSSGLPPGQATHTFMTNPHQVGSISDDPSGIVTPSPLFTDSISPAPNQGHEGFQGSNLQPNSVNMQRPMAVNNLHLQRSQLSQSIMSNDNGTARYSAIPKDVSRIPNAIQALPVQMPTPNVSSLPSGPSISNFTGNCSSLPTRTSVPSLSIVAGSDSLQSDSLQQQHISQSVLPRRPASQVVELMTPVQVAQSSFQVSSGLRASHQMNPINPRMPPMVSPPPHLRSSQVPRSQISPTASTGIVADQTAPTSQRHNRHMGFSAQQAMLRPRQPHTVPVQIQTSRSDSFPLPMNLENVRARFGEHGPASGGAVQSVTRTEDLLDVQAEQNWRPSGRMRGSLSGLAFSDALSQFMIRPTEMGPSSPSTSTGPHSSQNTVAPHLKVLLANRNLHFSQSLDGGMGPATGTGG